MIKKSLISLGTAGTIAACGGGGGSSDTTPVVVDPILTKTQSLEVMAKNLTNVTHDVAVQVGFSPLQTLTCDNLGSFLVSNQSKTVCQIYNVTGTEGVAKISPNGVDLVSRVSAGTNTFVENESKNDLSSAKWGPVLNEVVSLTSKMGEPLTVEFKVKGSGSDSGYCDIASSTGVIGNTGNLFNKGKNSNGLTLLEVTSQNSFSLPEGTYAFNCTFNDGLNGLNGLNKVDGAASLQVTHINAIPVISDVQSPLKLTIGKEGILGGVCNDAESGVLSLTPLTYTPVGPDAINIVRTCTDGIASVTYAQTVTGSCESGKVYDGKNCIVPVNTSPVISGVGSIELLIGQDSNLGGVCHDAESGILNLNPLTYTMLTPGPVTVVRSCADGVNTVTANQSVTGKCSIGTGWYSNACRAPINCSGNWEDTKTCSNSSGPGSLIQSYSILTAAQYGGSSCPANNGDTRVGGTPCDTTPEPPLCPPGTTWNGISCT